MFYIFTVTVYFDHLNERSAYERKEFWSFQRREVGVIEGKELSKLGIKEVI